MNDVKLLSASHHSSNDAVVIDFFVQVTRVATSKLHASKVVDMHIVEVRIDVLTIAIEVIWRHDVADALLYVVVVDIAPRNGHAVHADNLARIALFVAKGTRQTENGVDVALSVQALCNAIVSGGESTEYMRRKLPSEH